jgi:cellulose synthase operon protein C
MDTRERSITSQMTAPPGTTQVAIPADAEVQALLAAYEREAKALGNEPAAARLYHEMGVLWEERLKSPRNAAVCYQNAYRLNPNYLPNIQSARALFADVGNWQLVVQLVDAEAQAAPTESERTALLIEKATILEEKLSRPDEALTLLQALATKVPDDVGVLGQLEASFVARGDYESLCGIYLKLADAVKDDELRAYYFAAAAGLAEDRLKKPDEAAALYRKAFAVAPKSDPVLLASVKRHAEREGKSDEVLRALAIEAQGAAGNSAPVMYRICRVYERLGRVDDALQALLAARKTAPDDPLILAELARMFESQARWEELAGVLVARAASIKDESELVAVNLRLGALFEEKLKREDDAIARYNAVLAVQPRNSVAISSLGKLYARRGDWPGLLAIYEAEIATAAEDPKQKVAKMYKAAELLEEKLARVDDAIRRYNEILALSPGYLPAQKALARLYEKQGRFAELVAMHEQDLVSTKDRDQIVAILSRLALLCEDRLNDIPRAISYLKRVLEVVPNHLPTIRSLSRLAERFGDWEQLVNMNALEADLAGDTKEVLSLLHRNAEILDEQISDPERAINAYRKVLTLSPAYLPALRALGRLYGQAGRWEELVEMNRQEAEVVASPDYAASLVYRTGELYEEKLKQTDQAIAAYQEVLTLSPNYFPALNALSRIYRSQGAWESLVDVLRSEAAVRIDPSERAHTLFQVAVLWEEELNRTDRAIDAYQEVLRLAPAHTPTLRALERMYATQENWRELVSIHEREIQITGAASEKVAAYAKLARLYLERLNEPNRAAQCYESILSQEPQNLFALKGLERIRSSDRARRAEIRTRLAHTVSDPQAAAALYLASAQDREQAGVLESSDNLNRAAALAPNDPRTVTTIERAYRKAGDFDAYAASLERRMTATSDPEMKLALAMRLGDVCERNLADLPRAQGVYRIAFEAAPDHLPTLRALRRIAVAQGTYPEVQRLLMAEGEASRDVRGAVEAFLEAGRIALDRLGNADLARAAFGKALERDPMDPRAAEKYEELVASSGGAAEVAILHERRGDAKAQAKDVKGAAEEYFQAAKAYLERLNIPEKAAEVADKALALSPQHPGALLLRADVAEQAEQFETAASLLVRRVEVGGEPNELAAIHVRLGALYQERLGDVSRAAAHLGTALAADPGNAGALERLGKAHFAAGNWTGAVDVYQRLIEVTSDARRKTSFVFQLGRVYEEGLGDTANAIVQYRKAMDLAPSESQALDRLAVLYEKTGALPELVRILEKQASESTDRAKVFAMRRKLGSLLAKRGEVPRAAAALRQAVELNPDDLETRVELAELLSREAATFPAGIEEHRNLLRLQPFRVESMHSLFRLYDASRQPDRAFCAASMLTFLRAASEVEIAWFSEARNRVPDPARTNERLSRADFDSVLAHPRDRSPLSEMMRLIGGDLHKMYEPDLGRYEVHPKADRLKSDHPLHRAVRHLADIAEVEKFDVYLSKRGASVALENTDPLSLIVGAEILRRYTDREQRFLLARGVIGLRNRTALVHRLSLAELTDLLGAAARAVSPEFNRMGNVDQDLTKRVRKALPGRVLKALEAPVAELSAMRTIDVANWLGSIPLTADRFGLLACGDVVAALNLLLREDPGVAGKRLDTLEQLTAAAANRRDLQELLTFLLSDDHFRLRGRMKIALGS